MEASEVKSKVDLLALLHWMLVVHYLSSSVLCGCRVAVVWCVYVCCGSVAA